MLDERTFEFSVYLKINSEIKNNIKIEKRLHA
jgi:hypothetical protein